MGTRSCAPALAVVAVFAAGAGVARADSADESDPPRPRARYYGWYLLAADATSDVLVVAGITADRWPNAMWVAGMAGQAASPILHAVHGEREHAMHSVLLRTLLPAAGAFAGHVIASSRCTEGWGCGIAQAGFRIGGGVTGLVVAQLVDDTLLAWHRPPSRSRAPTTVTPFVAVTGTDLHVGLAGTFR